MCSSMGMMLLPSHTLSSSLGLRLDPAQHPGLQFTLGLSTTSGRNCLCQAVGLDSAFHLASVALGCEGGLA